MNTASISVSNRAGVSDNVVVVRDVSLFAPGVLGDELGGDPEIEIFVDLHDAPGSWRCRRRPPRPPAWCRAARWDPSTPRWRPPAPGLRSRAGPPRCPRPTVSSRYERASMIVTSNKPFSAWGEIFGDDMAATAMIDRLIHHSEILSLKGDSYRLRGKDLDARIAAKSAELA
jgi:hypothetical protein